MTRTTPAIKAHLAYMVKKAQMRSSQPARGTRLKRTKAGIEEHLARHPHDAASAAHLGKVNARLDELRGRV